MVENKVRWKKVMAIVAIGLASVHYCHYFSSPKAKMETAPSTIPPPQPGREVWVYDLYRNQWVYKDQLPSPAKEVINSSRGNSKKELKKYLEEHIKGYKNKTYWGEEYDHIDPEDKYEHDRIDFDEIENEYGRKK